MFYKESRVKIPLGGVEQNDQELHGGFVTSPGNYY
jgi:hypothetical protein